MRRVCSVACRQAPAQPMHPEASHQASHLVPTMTTGGHARQHTLTHTICIKLTIASTSSQLPVRNCQMCETRPSSSYLRRYSPAMLLARQVGHLANRRPAQQQQGQEAWLVRRRKHDADESPEAVVGAEWWRLTPLVECLAGHRRTPDSMRQNTISRWKVFEEQQSSTLCKRSWASCANCNEPGGKGRPHDCVT